MLYNNAYYIFGVKNEKKYPNSDCYNDTPINFNRMQ
jgi:hypothetical protein